MIDIDSLNNIIQEFAEKYNFIQKSDITRVEKIKDLEKRLKTEFFNTRDFHEKVGNYLKNYRSHITPLNIRICRARKKFGMTQKQLAEYFGFNSHVSIALFEKGLRFPSSRILKWLKDMGM